MNRSFVHLELNVDDTAQARTFYRDLFGWVFSDVPMEDDTIYTQIKPPMGPGGGIQKKPTADAPPMWLPYVGVDSVKDTLARARRSGARIVADYMEVPGYGALAIIADPTGAWLGLWETQTGPREDGPQPGTEETPVEAEPKKGPPRRAAGQKTAKKSSSKKKPKKKSGKKKATTKKSGKKKAAKKKAGKKKSTTKTSGRKKAGKKKSTTKKSGKKKAAKHKSGKKKSTTKKSGRKKSTTKKRRR